MKKTFDLTHPKIKYARMVEAVRRDIRKYIKRERTRTELPEGVDFWDFACRFGDTEADARPVHLAEIGPCIDEAVARKLTSFYVEILRTEGKRSKMPVLEKSTAAEQENSSESDVVS